MQTPSLESLVKQAQDGNKDALQQVLENIKTDVYSLAVKFLWDLHDAEDASQDILLSIVMNLGSFRGDSLFKTWVYRVACNRLIALKKQRMEKQNLSFDLMAEDLNHGLETPERSEETAPEYHRILDEIRIGCTLAMLQCLDRKSRLCYILGEIMELDQKDASAILELSQPAYRKRLSRARSAITEFMTEYCGLFNPNNGCRCSKRVKRAIALQRVNPENLIFTEAGHPSSNYATTLKTIRELTQARRAAALYRSQPTVRSNDNFANWFKAALDNFSF